ncbi:hypothetical protein C8J56DRAFT_922309 [Mycena floridula]|nr:hypothetical protein C8J56DRAFT_922309 [Mycena floridula]
MVRRILAWMFTPTWATGRKIFPSVFAHPSTLKASSRPPTRIRRDSSLLVSFSFFLSRSTQWLLTNSSGWRSMVVFFPFAGLRARA